MAFLIGACCNDQIVTDPGSGGSGGGGTSGDSSGKNEEISFVNVPTLTIPWNATRIARFGTAAMIIVELLGDDDVYRVTPCQITPDVIPNTTQYAIDFGETAATGRVIIS